MVETIDMLWRVAPSRCNVLVTGESDTGKEVVVRTLHAMSPRKDAPLVAVNCGAITSARSRTASSAPRSSRRDS